MIIWILISFSFSVHLFLHRPRTQNSRIIGQYTHNLLGLKTLSFSVLLFIHKNMDKRSPNWVRHAKCTWSSFILLQRSSNTLMILTGKVSAQVLLLAGQNRAICMCLTCKNWLTDSPEPQLQSPFLRSKIHISLQSIKIRKLIMHHPPLQKCRTLTDEMGLKLIARPVAKKVQRSLFAFQSNCSAGAE